jgi:DNA-directed RNA polymerase specialized sigma subunit
MGKRKQLDELDEKLERQVRRDLKLPDPGTAIGEKIKRKAAAIEKATRERDNLIRQASIEQRMPLRKIAEYADLSHMSVSRILHDVASPAGFGQRRSRANRQHVA